MRITLKNMNNLKEYSLDVPFNRSELEVAYNELEVPKEDVIDILANVEYIHIHHYGYCGTIIECYLERTIPIYDYMLLNAIMHAYCRLDEWRHSIANNIFNGISPTDLTVLCSILSEVEADNFEYNEIYRCPYGDSIYADFGYTFGEVNVSTEFEEYVDWEQYGEEILENGNYILVDDGYINDPDDYMDYEIWNERELEDGSYVTAILGDSFIINSDHCKTDTRKMNLDNDAFSDFLSA